MNQGLMSRPVWALALGLLLTTVGCGEGAKTPPAAGTGSGTAAGSAAVTMDEAATTDSKNEIELAMAELSPEDRKLAEAQKLCPIGDSPLGSMGKPFKINVKGRDVFLCCAGCENAVKEDPDAILAKLDAGLEPPAAETN